MILTALTGKVVDPVSLLPDWVMPTPEFTKEEKDRRLKRLKEKLKIED